MFTGTEWGNRTIDRKDFRNSVYYTEDRKVYQIDETYQPVYLGRELSWNRLSPNGTTLYFMKNDRLFRADGPPKNGTPFLIGEQISDYRLSDDGRSVGFVTADGGLFIQKNAGKAVKIADGLDTNGERRPAWQFAFGENSRVYYLANGSLYVSKDRKQGPLLPTPVGKALEVRQIGAVLVLTVSVDSENHAYYSTDGKTFLPLAKMPPLPLDSPLSGC